MKLYYDILTRVEPVNSLLVVVVAVVVVVVVVVGFVASITNMYIQYMFKHAIKFLISTTIYYKLPILICISGFLVVTTSEVDTLSSFTGFDIK